MADARLLRKKISEDRQVAQLSEPSALLYVLSIPHLDVDGRMNGLPALVRGTVVPEFAQARPHVWTDQRVAAYILEWTATIDDSGQVDPLAVWYAIDGKSVCFFTGFAANQTVRRDRESPSRFPAPSHELLAQPVLASARLAELANSGLTPGPEVEVQEVLTSGLYVAPARARGPIAQGLQIAEELERARDSARASRGFSDLPAGSTLTPSDDELLSVYRSLRGADDGTMHQLKVWRRRGCGEREFAVSMESLKNRRQSGRRLDNEARYFCSELSRLLRERQEAAA